MKPFVFPRFSRPTTRIKAMLANYQAGKAAAGAVDTITLPSVGGQYAYRTDGRLVRDGVVQDARRGN